MPFLSLIILFKDRNDTLSLNFFSMNRDNGENFHFFVLSFFSKSKKIDFAIPRYELF